MSGNDGFVRMTGLRGGRFKRRGRGEYGVETRDWIPADAGTMGVIEGRKAGFLGRCLVQPETGVWIPACAGKTRVRQ